MEAPGLQKWDPKLVVGGEGPTEKEGEPAEAGPKRKPGTNKRPEKRRKVNDIGQQDAELPGEAGDPVVGNCCSRICSSDLQALCDHCGATPDLNLKQSPY